MNVENRFRGGLDGAMLRLAVLRVAPPADTITLFSSVDRAVAKREAGAGRLGQTG